jgi:putative peptidoglycan lipid II flippase
VTVVAGLGRRVSTWFQASVNRRILAAALTVGGFSLLVKIVAMAKELTVAYQFGTGDAVDAFLIAYLVPQLVLNVVAGSLAPAFTPVYIEVRETEGAVAARRLFESATAGSVVILLALTCGLIVFMPLVLRFLASGFSPGKLALTHSLFLLLCPVVLLNALVTMWTAVLNAEHRFASLAFAPVCVPLLTLVMILVSGRSWGIYALAVGTVIGFLGQCGILAVAVTRRRLPIIPRWTGVTPAMRRVASQYLPMVAGTTLTTSSWAIGQAMAAMLPAGSVASLNYGNKVVSMISEIGSMALATAVLPHFSVMVARREWVAIRRTLRVYVRLIVVIAVPATVALIVASPTIVRILFQRGAFTAGDTRLVATIQSLYLAQVPFVMIGMLFVRLASSLQRNRIFFVGAMVTLPLNVVLNLTFMRLLGVGGIALSTTLVFLFFCCYLMVSVRRALVSEERRQR